MTLKRRRNRNIKLTDDRKSQKLNYRKRKSTLKNKARELATLCDVTVCLICFGPDGEVVTWPENKTEVQHVFNKYREIGVNVKERQSLFGFLESKKEKLEQKLGTMEWKESRERKVGKGKRNVGTFSSWDEKLNQFSVEALMDLCNSLEYKLQNLNTKIQLIQTTENEIQKAAKIQGYQQSQAIGWMNGECSVLLRAMFGNEQVLAAFGMSEAWPEGYCTNMWSNDYDYWLTSSMISNDQPVLAPPTKDEAWNKDCNADAEISSNNNNCLPPTTMFADRPVLAASPANSEAWSGNNNNTKNNSNRNLFTDSDWFWGTAELCFYD